MTGHRGKFVPMPLVAYISNEEGNKKGEKRVKTHKRRERTRERRACEIPVDYPATSTAMAR